MSRRTSRRTRYSTGKGWSAAGAAGCGVTAVAAPHYGKGAGERVAYKLGDP